MAASDRRDEVIVTTGAPAPTLESTATTAPGGGAPMQASGWRGRSELLYFAFRNWKFVVGIGVVLSMLALALVGPMLTEYEPLAFSGPTDERPSSEHWFGTTSFGQDVFSQFVYGLRAAFVVGAVGGGIAWLVGAAVGFTAGYRGGWIDDVVMRVADFVLILPVIYVALMLRAVMPLVLPPATVFVSMATIFTLLGWPFVAKGVRGIIATEREQEYVAAARSLGASGWHLLSRHLLPACRGFLLAQAALLLPAFVLAEATLSYIGLGFPEHLPTWGTMLIEAASVTAMTRFPWMLAPAAAIFLVVLSANVILQSDKIVRRPI